MAPVASSDGVVIYCPREGRYAFYNSPYPAHRLLTGVDIYPDTLFGSAMPSPVEGEILQVRHLKAPSGQGFKDAGYEVVTIIRSAQDPEKVIKILHVDTSIEVGEKIRMGQELGILIRSGYFGYHTPLHAHIEVRKPSDKLRVRGGYHIASLLPLDDLKPTEKLSGVVIESRPEYALIQLDEGTTQGVVADIGGVAGFLDGGIPIYGWFGAHIPRPPRNDTVKLIGKPIGKIRNVQGRTCVADCTEFNAKFERTPLNLFFLLKPDGPALIAATSRKSTGLRLEESSYVSLIVE